MTNHVSYKVQMVSDQLQSQLEPNNHANHMTLPPSEKWYLCFQIDEKTEWLSQCAK